MCLDQISVILTQLSAKVTQLSVSCLSQEVNVAAMWTHTVTHIKPTLTSVLLAVLKCKQPLSTWLSCVIRDIRSHIWLISITECFIIPSISFTFHIIILGISLTVMLTDALFVYSSLIFARCIVLPVIQNVLYTSWCNFMYFVCLSCTILFSLFVLILCG